MSFPPCPFHWSEYKDNILIDYLRQNIALAKIAALMHEAYATVSSRTSTIIYHLYRNGHSLSSIKGTTNYRDWETDRKSTRLNSSH